MTLRDSIVSLNTSGYTGGGIGHVFSDGKLSIENSIIVANTAADGGGGIYYDGDELRIERVTVYGNNTRFSFGGGASTVGAEVVVEKSLFSHNIIGLWGEEAKPSLLKGGGGLGIGSGEVRITNTTIDNNFGSSGGGLRTNTPVKLVNVTIANNTALVEGGGILSFDDDNDVSIRNSIIANNGPDNCAGVASLSLGNNIADDKTCGLKAAKDKENTDPLLGVLGNYGGATRTLPLKAGSPAINAAAEADLNFDQRGVARPKLGGFDVGAFEYNGRPVLSITDDVGRTAACDQDRNGRIDFVDLDRLITTFPAFSGRFRGDADAALERCVRRCTHAGCPSRALIEKPRRRAG